MSRNDVVDLHFSHLKNTVGSCNNVLKRLRRDGHIEASVKTQPYLYFPSPSPIKKDSQKAGHFLAIVDFYKQLLQHDNPKHLVVEPKFGKEYMEPDIFMIWQGAPFFVEIQCSVYSSKVMKAKLERYEKYVLSDEWKKETWQPKNKKIFPYIWIITDTFYNIEHKQMKIFQTKNVSDFLQSIS